MVRFREAAELGNATAQFAVATMHAHGLGNAQRSEPLSILNMYYAALGGEVAAQMAMGYRYLYVRPGTGSPYACW